MIRATVAALLSALLMTLPAQAAAPKQQQKKHVQQKNKNIQRPKKPVQRQKKQVARQKKQDQHQNTQDRQLLMLDLNTRIEQRCNERASSDVSRENKDLRVDRVIAYAFADTVVNGTEVNAPGAIARSRGKWYRLSFRCRTTDNGLGIVSFEHSLGPEVPGWHQGRLAD